MLVEARPERRPLVPGATPLHWACWRLRGGGRLRSACRRLRGGGRLRSACRRLPGGRRRSVSFGWFADARRKSAAEGRSKLYSFICSYSGDRLHPRTPDPRPRSPNGVPGRVSHATGRWGINRLRGGVARLALMKVHVRVGCCMRFTRGLLRRTPVSGQPTKRWPDGTLAAYRLTERMSWATAATYPA